MYRIKTDIKKADPHHGYLQRGKDFDIVFADNINTEQYWDMQEDAQQEDTDAFPSWVEDWYGFLFYVQDFLTNWEWEGVQFPDSYLTLITKSGQRISSDEFVDFHDFMKAIKPFSQNHFAAALFNDLGFEYFWVNGWDGYQQLQDYTGWFDMDIYYDWI